MASKGVLTTIRRCRFEIWAAQQSPSARSSSWNKPTGDQYSLARRSPCSRRYVDENDHNSTVHQARLVGTRLALGTSDLVIFRARALKDAGGLKPPGSVLEGLRLTSSASG